jgi:hypothetical protein
MAPGNPAIAPVAHLPVAGPAIQPVSSMPWPVRDAIWSKSEQIAKHPPLCRDIQPWCRNDLSVSFAVVCANFLRVASSDSKTANRDQLMHDATIELISAQAEMLFVPNTSGTSYHKAIMDRIDEFGICKSQDKELSAPNLLLNRPAPRSEEEKNARRFNNMVNHGNYGKAKRALQPEPMADVNDPAVRKVIHDTFRPRSDVKMDPKPREAEPFLISENLVKKQLHKHAQACAGVSGMSFQFLLAVWKNKICRAAISSFVNAFVNGRLPNSLKPVLLATRLIPLVKQDGTGRLRLIEAGETLRRLAVSCAVTSLKSVCCKELMPIQRAVAVPSGMQSIVLETQGLIKNFNDWGVVDIDFTDAFPSVDIASALNTFFKMPAFKKLWNVVDWCYRDPYPTFVVDKSGCVVDKLVHGNGLGQGCNATTLLYCTTTIALYRAALDVPVSVGVSNIRVSGFVDNLKIQGPLPALKVATEKVIQKAPDFNARISLPKSRLYHTGSALDAESVSAIEWFNNEAKILPTTQAFNISERRLEKISFNARLFTMLVSKSSRRG